MKIGWMRELFTFSRKERTGIIGLLFVIFVLIVVGKLIPLFIPPEQNDFSAWETEVNGYLAKKANGNPVDCVLLPVEFNPNEVDSVHLSNMGLPPKVVSNWIKYLGKGGRFRDKEGVKKIYGMTPEIFGQLDRFIIIPEGKKGEVGTGVDKRRIQSSHFATRDTLFRKPDPGKERIRVQELNSTDSVRLLDIPGIGPVYASRIIRYRNLLGGYYAVSQLREVYGMREENFRIVSSYFTADSSSLKTFNINFSTLQEMGRHPYIGFRTARKIYRLRDKMGKFSSPDDLATVVADDSLKRLIPYMKFNQ